MSELYNLYLPRNPNLHIRIPEMFLLTLTAFTRMSGNVMAISWGRFVHLTRRDEFGNPLKSWFFLGWGESCANKSVVPLVCPYLHIFILQKISVYLILLNIWDDSSLKSWSWGFKCLVNALCWHLQLMPVCVGVQNWLLLVYMYLWPSDIILQVATRPEFIFVCV